MAANLDLTHGLIVSEAVMMGLAPTLGRDRAHDLVYAVCRQALEQERPLAELLNQQKEVKAHLSEEEIEHLTDPAAYLGLASAMVDRVLQPV